MLRHRDQVASELAGRDAASSRPAPPAAGGVGRRAPRRGSGSPSPLRQRDLVRERSYTAWGWSWLEGLLQDVLYGLRAMLRSPGITLVALLSLALGIGANTAIFSLMDAVMLRSLPVKKPQQLVMLGMEAIQAESPMISAQLDFTRIPSIASCRSRIRSSRKQPLSSVCQATCTAPCRVAIRPSRCMCNWSPAHISLCWASKP